MRILGVYDKENLKNTWEITLDDVEMRVFKSILNNEPVKSTLEDFLIKKTIKEFIYNYEMIEMMKLEEHIK